MDCRQVSGHELAEKYVSGQLDAELQDQFEVHMLDCPECLSTVEALMSVRNSLAAQADEIRKLSTRPARRFSLVWTLAASLLVAGVVAFYFMQSGSHHQPDRMAAQPPSTPWVGSIAFPTQLSRMKMLHSMSQSRHMSWQVQDTRWNQLEALSTVLLTALIYIRSGDSA